MKKLLSINLLLLSIAMIFILISCSQEPSKDLLKKEVENYYYQNENNIYIVYRGGGREFDRRRGDNFEITDVNITDMSYKDDEGQIKILLSGKFVLYRSYLKNNEVSFSNFPDQLEIKKYDSGWKVSSKPYTRFEFDFDEKKHRISR